MKKQKEMQRKQYEIENMRIFNQLRSKFAMKKMRTVLKEEAKFSEAVAS